MVFISYIIPCYNVSNYLPRCFDSLSKQTDKIGVEYIFVNDGSTDNTLDILNEFAQKDGRSLIINQENQGVSAARNSGLRKAKGEYVFFLDGDDYLTDEASQILYDQVTNEKPDIIVSKAYVVRENNPEKTEWNLCAGISPGIVAVEEFVKSVEILPISFKAYRREILLKNNIVFDEDLRVGEVYAFFLHAMAFSKRISFTDKRVMCYLQRDGSVMREYNIERDYTIINTINRIDEYTHFYDFDITNTISYNRSFYNIINSFAMSKYLKFRYTDEIGMFLKKVVNNEIFRRIMKMNIRYPYLNSRTIIIVSLLYLPMKVSFMLIGLKSILNFKK